MNLNMFPQAVYQLLFALYFFVPLLPSSLRALTSAQVARCGEGPPAWHMFALQLMCLPGDSKPW